jgi:transmembrane sensor
MEKKVNSKKDFTEREIGRYLAGELETKESVEVETWISHDPENKKKFLEYKGIWLLSGQTTESKLIDIDKARSKVLKKLPGFGRRRSLFTFLSKVAAVLFLPLLITSAAYFWYTRPFSNNAEFSNEIDVSFGTVIHFVLADGTNVWLNSGSHFKYPAQFTGTARNVYLEGEAYFEVAENRKPFIVQTSQMEIVAKGTSFNVLAYPDDNRIMTTLVEGKILLYEVKPDSRPVFLTELKPNERAVYLLSGKNELSVSLTDAEKNTSWKEGKLIFHDDPFEEIVRKLNRWYNTDIKLMDPELKSYRYTATFTDETLIQVLELLKNSAPIKYTYSQRNKNHDGTFEKRVVEIRIRK